MSRQFWTDPNVLNGWTTPDSAWWSGERVFAARLS